MAVQQISCDSHFFIYNTANLSTYLYLPPTIPLINPPNIAYYSHDHTSDSLGTDSARATFRGRDTKGEESKEGEKEKAPSNARSFRKL